jgi:hypothetical protein
MHKSRLAGAVCLAASLAASAPLAQSHWLDTYKEPARRLIAEATSSAFAWNRLVPWIRDF